jgi:hypothetical protein
VRSAEIQGLTHLSNSMSTVKLNKKANQNIVVDNYRFPHRMLKVFQRFGKNYSCHLQGEYVLDGVGSLIDQAIGDE